MSLRPEIGFADLLRAFARLGPLSPAQQAAVAEVLGFVVSPVPASGDGGETPSGGDAEKSQDPTGPFEEQTLGDIVLSPRFAEVVMEAPPASSAAGDVAPTKATRPLELGLEQVWQPSPPPPPVVPRQRVGTLLRDAAVTEGGDGELDTDRLTVLIAEQMPLTALPRRPRPTLRRGGQLLLDLSDSMVPLRSDMFALAGRAAAVIPEAEVWYCSGPPTNGGARPMHRQLQPYDFPRRGSPVIIAGGWWEKERGGARLRAAAIQWRAFASAAREYGCPVHVVALGASGSDEAIARVMPIVPIRQQARSKPADVPTWTLESRELADLWRASPQAVQLGLVASLAVRVEPSLLRRLRLELCPEASAADEVMLWASDAIQARTKDLMEFTDAAQQILSTRLATDRVLLHAAREVIEGSHETYPDLLRLEEELRFRSVRGRQSDRAWIEDRLSGLENLGRWSGRRGLAQWASRVTRTVPGMIQSSRRLSGLAGWAANMTRSAEPDSAKKAWVDLAWSSKAGGRLVFRRSRRADPENGTAIPVPDMSPLTLTVEAGPVGRPRRRIPVTVADEWRSLDLPAGPVRVMAENGAVWRVRSRHDPDPVEIIAVPDDEEEASRLAESLRKRGVPVLGVHPPGPVQSSARGRRILVVSRASARSAKRWDPARSLVVTHGVLRGEVPEHLHQRWVADLALPGTAMAVLIDAIRKTDWADEAFPESLLEPWNDDARSAYPRDLPWSARPGRPVATELPDLDLAPVHFRPPVTESSHPLRPPLNGLIEWERGLPAGMAGAVLSEDSRLLTAAAWDIANHSSYRRRFPDGVYYYVGTRPDPRLALSAIAGMMKFHSGVPEYREHVRHLLQIGRCLVLLDDVMLAEPVTGPNGRTLCFGGKAAMERGQVHSYSFVLPRVPVVNLISIPRDRSIARSIASRLQRSGVGVRFYSLLRGWEDDADSVATIVLLTGHTSWTRVALTPEKMRKGRLLLVTRGDVRIPEELRDLPRFSDDEREGARTAWVEKLVHLVRGSSAV